MIGNSLVIKNFNIKFHLGLQYVRTYIGGLIIFRNVYELMSLCASRNVPLDVRLDVLSEVIMKITLAWDVTPCSLIERYQHFGINCYLYI
jgi:hypothetical protein